MGKETRDIKIKESWAGPPGLMGGEYDASATADWSVTEAEVKACQDAWAAAIVEISSVYAKKGDYVTAAGDAAANLYGYGHCNVLFKPTKAAEVPFRPTGADAMSYFVGHKA